MSVAIDPTMMTMPSSSTIDGIKPVEQKPPGHAAENIGEAFAKALSDARGLETDATKAAEKFAKGDTSIGIHEVVIAAEKANIAVRYATTLKNKAVEAYRELMNTQV